MNYQKILRSHQISDADITKLVEQFSARAASEDPQNRLPDAVYHSAAVDIAMGAIDLSEDTQNTMKVGHDARTWMQVLTGVQLD